MLLCQCNFPAIIFNNCFILSQEIFSQICKTIKQLILDPVLVSTLFIFNIQEGIIWALLLIVNFKNVLFIFIHVRGRKLNKEPPDILIIIFHALHECTLPVIGYFIGGNERYEELKRSTTWIRNIYNFMIQFIQKPIQNTFNHTKLLQFFSSFTTFFLWKYRMFKKKEIMRSRLTTVLELHFIE